MKKYILIVTKTPEQETLFTRTTEILKHDFNIIHAKNGTEVTGLLKMIKPVFAFINSNACKPNFEGGGYLITLISINKQIPVLFYNSQPGLVIFMNAHNKETVTVCTPENITSTVQGLKAFITNLNANKKLSSQGKK